MLTFLIVLFIVFAILTLRSDAVFIGSNIKWAEYPFMVKLDVARGSRKDVCTASAVTSRMLITSAHCVNDSPTDITATFSNGKTLKVNKVDVMINPKFGSTRMKYDIALIYLPEEFAMKTAIPIKFDTPSQLDASEAMLIGFGKDGLLDPKLKGGRVTLYDRDDFLTATNSRQRTVCDEFAANLSFFESSTKSCSRCSKIPGCSCGPTSICQADGSEEDVLQTFSGESGGTSFLLDSDGEIAATVAVNSDVVSRLEQFTGAKYGMFADLDTSKKWIEGAMDFKNIPETEFINPKKIVNTDRALPFYASLSGLLTGIILLFIVFYIFRRIEDRKRYVEGVKDV